MIHYLDLKFSEKPIKSTDVEVKVVDNNGNPVLDDNGKQKVIVKKDSPKAKLGSVAHYAIQDTVKALNKKYGLELKKYDLFGGDSEGYKEKFLKKVCRQIDFLNDRQDGVIEDVFNTEIKYENKKGYLDIDAYGLARSWSIDIVKIVEEELHRIVENEGISSIDELKNVDYMWVSDSCVTKINKFINSQLISVFREMKDAKIMINRGETFSSNLGLHPVNKPKENNTVIERESGLTI